MNRAPVVRTSSSFPLRLLHGGDYNPDQWLDRPEVLTEDIRLMHLAGVNSVSLGIFAWHALEPKEGDFNFEWLDATIQRLSDAGIGVILATPSGARPGWMSAQYPEVLRVRPDGGRNLHGGRHNHCYTSPVYREKTRIINTHLAQRYGEVEAVQLWHLSNEYSGECHCELCQKAFRTWLKDQYANDLDALNRAWWSAFWSHTYASWDEIQSPSPIGETSLHGLSLDWKRFVTHQTRDFMNHEISTLRAVTTDIPITTNLMGFFPGIDYMKLGGDLDVVSWDSYPLWGGDAQPDWKLAHQIAAAHDLMRGCKPGVPFLLMESTPSMTNWMPVAKPKRPGVHLASSLLAVAHGSDSVQYFQWRKGRGSSEKFHGAVVDHVGHEHTRVFGDVSDVGSAFAKLEEVAGSTYPAEVAVIFDWENRWAMEAAQGPRNDDKMRYPETVQEHAEAFSRLSVNVDMIGSEQPLDSYKLVVAPMLYMVKPAFVQGITDFVRNGGTFVATYWSGIVDEHDLCFTNGFPGPLSEVLGIWSEEIDALYDSDSNSLIPSASGILAGHSEYRIRELCDLIHLKGAVSHGTYGSDFYADRPALTANIFGDGTAYYVACRTDQDFLNDFYANVVDSVRPVRAFTKPLPQSAHATLRTATESDGSITEYRFLLNMGDETVQIPECADGDTVLFHSPPACGLARSQSEDQGPTSDTVLAPFAVQVRRRSVS